VASLAMGSTSVTAMIVVQLRKYNCV